VEWQFVPWLAAKNSCCWTLSGSITLLLVVFLLTKTVINMFICNSAFVSYIIFLIDKLLPVPAPPSPPVRMAPIVADESSFYKTVDEVIRQIIYDDE
jgi:hypothetical protein